MKTNLQQKHIISALVDNNPGVVSRISGLFTRRGYNIESFVTCITLNPEVYHLTISVLCTKEELDLLMRQLGRVMEVITIFSADDTDCVAREIMLLKVAASIEMRSEIVKLTGVLGLKVASISDTSVIIEASGDDQQLEGVMRTFEPFGIVDMIRSGTIAMNV